MDNSSHIIYKHNKKVKRRVSNQTKPYDNKKKSTSEEKSAIKIKRQEHGRSVIGQNQPDPISLIGVPDSEHSSLGRFFLEEIDVKTKLLAALPGNKKNRKLIAITDTITQSKKKKCLEPSIMSLKDVSSEKVECCTDKTKRPALPMMEKKLKPNADDSFSQLKKEKCLEPSVMNLKDVSSEEVQCCTDITKRPALPIMEKKLKPNPEDSFSQLKKKIYVKPSIVGLQYVCDVKEDVLENTNHPESNFSSDNSEKISEETKNRATEAPIRTPAFIQFGYLEVETWFSAEFPQEPDAEKLIFCEYCLKYNQCKSVMDIHMRNCNWTSPPGTQIYRNGSLTVYEVDGNVDKIYCDTLCRIGKLFLNEETLEYDVEQFRFYIMTRNDRFGNHLVGYFSKKKQRQDNFNVNCIIVMPQYQRHGYGRLLIELSYLLSKIEKRPGTPKTPFTVLGQKLYDSYWQSVILEYLDKNIYNGDNIYITDVTRITGLMGQDIIDTLNSLNFVVEVFNRTKICIDWNVVDSHMQRKNLSKHDHIEPQKLNWTPY
ncbi:hypothetical protein ACI65C_008093 [Semiaphis heraclei]